MTPCAIAREPRLCQLVLRLLALFLLAVLASCANEPDDGLAPEFGTDGILIVDSAGRAHGSAVALTPRGGAVIGGTALGPGRPPAEPLVLAKVTSSGKLDRTFGRRGVVSLSGEGPLDRVVVQSNSRIVAASGSTLVRLASNGAQDRSFGESGIVALQVPGEAISTMALSYVDERLVAVVALKEKVVVAKVRLDGTPETLFGQDGIFILDMEARSATVDSRGRAVIGGLQAGAAVIVRLTTAGSLDPGFGERGLVTLPSDPTVVRSLGGSDLAVVSHNSRGMVPDAQVLRLKSDGSQDKRFAQRGVLEVGGGNFAVVDLVGLKGGRFGVIGTWGGGSGGFVSLYEPNGAAVGDANPVDVTDRLENFASGVAVGGRSILLVATAGKAGNERVAVARTIPLAG